jgi:uncharacterized protein YqhQ
MALQAMTTRVPGEAELEVALTSLRKVLWREAQPALNEEGGRQLERYANFAEVTAKLV